MLRSPKIPNIRGKVKQNKRLRRMTVCIAAIARNGQNIICVADKALSYGDAIQWESDCAKIIPLGENDAVVLTAGSDIYIMRVLQKIKTFDIQSKNTADITLFLESKYQEAFSEAQEIEILKPQMLTKKQYVDAIAIANENSYMASLAVKMEKFDFDCGLLVCGFDDKKQPYIFSINPPGIVTDYTNIGFHAIGSGALHALSRLLFSGHERKDGAAHTLYDCFDAKAQAELTSTVGYEWDTLLLNEKGIFELDKKAKLLFERVWAKTNRSPWVPRKREDVKDPPEDWQKQLEDFIRASFNPATAKSKQVKSKKSPSHKGKVKLIK